MKTKALIDKGFNFTSEINTTERSHENIEVFSLQLIIKKFVLFPSILTQSQERYKIISQVKKLQTWRGSVAPAVKTSTRVLRTHLMRKATCTSDRFYCRSIFFQNLANWKLDK